MGMSLFMRPIGLHEGISVHAHTLAAIRNARTHNSVDAVVFVAFEELTEAKLKANDFKVASLRDLCPVIRVTIKRPRHYNPNKDLLVNNHALLGNQFPNTLAAVAQLNKLFGSKHGLTIKDDIELAQNIDDQMKLIKSERDELRDARLESDVLDAIGDIITVVDGIPFKSGLTISDDVFNAVIRCGEYGPDAYTHKDFNKLANVLIPNNILLGLVPGKDCPGIKDYAYAIWQSERAQIEHACLMRGYDPLKVYWEVHRSNMSKFCDSWEEASTTCAFYANKHGLFYSPNNPTDSDFKVVEVYGRYVVKTAREVMFGSEVVPVEKFLKGPKFFEPDFSKPELFTK